MHYDMGRFDQPLLDETQPKAHVWTDIGEAEVENSIFGKAKVRVYRKRDEVRGALRWTLATIVLVAGAVWLIQDFSRQPEIVYVAPPAPVAEVVPAEPPVPVRTAPQISTSVTPSIATHSPAPQLHAQSAPVAARPLPRAPVVAGASAPVAARPAAVVAKPATAPVAVANKPLAPAVPATAKPDVSKTPAGAASAVPATN